MTLTNRQISELLARAAEDEPTEHRRKALQKASRAALFSWEQEAADLVAASGRSLTELPAVGPWLARGILRLLERPEDAEPPDPPPLRDGFLTLAEVRASMSGHPEWRDSLRADLQMHSTYSDGKATLREMADSCEGLGYEFVAITDHSQGLKIAGGMDEEELAEQAADVSQVNVELEARGSTLRVLHGIEMNLSPEGEGDMDPAVLSRLDLVLGAFHSKLRVVEDQTDRYLAALRNPTVNVLAHPRGRRFNTREGLHADWRRVLEEAAARDKAMEIDAFPDRQDLSVDLLTLAREVGVWISIGTDAHATWELGFMEFGLAAAIRAGISRDRILNFSRVDEVRAWAAETRAGA